jgi:hypothetical protein
MERKKRRVNIHLRWLEPSYACCPALSELPMHRSWNRVGKSSGYLSVEDALGPLLKRLFHSILELSAMVDTMTVAVCEGG